MSTLIGQTGLDKHAKKLQDCRDIVQTILDFGVDQFQIVRIIKLLSLELEIREDMIEIKEICDKIENRDKTSLSSIIQTFENDDEE